MEEGEFLTDESCPHVRVRVVFDPDGADLEDEASPLVVRLDDQGRTKIVSGYEGAFDPGRIGDAEKVCRYLWLGYGARAEFVGAPDPRTFAFVVVAHPDFVADMGGEGDQAPSEKWITQNLALTVKEVTAYAAGEAWAFVVEKLVTGTQTRTYDDQHHADESEEFTEWEEDATLGVYLDYDYAKDEAEDHLAGEVRDCKKRTPHGP